MQRLDDYKSGKRHGTAEEDIRKEEVNDDDQRVEIENVSQGDRFNLASRAGGGRRATELSRERGTNQDSSAPNKHLPP